MVAKKKPEPARAATPSERVTQVWHSYPKLTLATVGTLIAIVTGVMPYVTGWINDFIRRAEFDAHAQTEARRGAWRDVQTIRLEAVASRNRVNDCDLLKERGRTLTPLERATCAQYSQELDEANKRLEVARTAAMALSGGKKHEGPE